MAKYITRTIVTYNTKVTFVMNGQIDTYKLNGEVGKKEAKKFLSQYSEIMILLLFPVKKRKSLPQSTRCLKKILLPWQQKKALVTLISNKPLC